MDLLVPTMITTDLEPDDILALYLYFANLTSQYKKWCEEKGKKMPYPVKMIVVGENDPKVKKEKLSRYIEHWKNFNLIPTHVIITIAQGTPSKKPFEREGQEFENFSISSDETTFIDVEKSIQNFLEIYRDEKLIVALKPIRDLLKCYLTTTNKKLWKDVNLAIYGSFNIRVVICQNENISKTIIELFSVVKKVFYYERFLATPENLGVGNSKTLPNFAKLLQTRKEFFEPFFKCMDLWNEHLYEKKLLTFKQLLNMNYKEGMEIDLDKFKFKRKTDKEPAQRTLQIIRAIEHSRKEKDFEVVLADIGIMAVLVSPKTFEKNMSRVDIVFQKETNYTQYKDNEKSNIFTFKNVNVVEIDNILFENLK